MPQLPEPGSEGAWGEMLNEFLRVEHQDDGSLKIRTDHTFDTMQPKTFVTVGMRDADYIADGTADDVAINAAISSVNAAGGGIVYIKAGGYQITRRIVPKNNVHLRGETMFVTKLAATSTLRAGIIDNMNESTKENPTVNFILSDLELDGTNFVQANNRWFKGINSKAWLNCKIYRVYCHHCTATGIGVDDWDGGTIDHCIAAYNGTYNGGINSLSHNGFGIASGYIPKESMIVSNNISIGNSNNGYLIEADSTGTGEQALYQFLNNISINDGYGMTNSGTPNVSFINNHIYGSTASGIRLNKFGASHFASHNVIKNNIISSAAKYGIWVGNDQPEYIIEGNIIKLCREDGIRAEGAQGSIINNHIHDNGGHGLTIGSVAGGGAVSNCIISNNLIYNNSKLLPNLSGIYLNSMSGNFTDSIITGNRCYDNQATKTQQYGIHIPAGKVGTMTNVLISHNSLAGNKRDGLLNQSTSSTITFDNNIGVNPRWLYPQGNVAGATTFNRLNGSVIAATLVGNIAVDLPAAVMPGDTLTLKLTQDSSGGRTVTWPANFKKAGGSLVLSTQPGVLDIIHMVWDGINWNEVSRSLNIT